MSESVPLGPHMMDNAAGMPPEVVEKFRAAARQATQEKLRTTVQSLIEQVRWPLVSRLTLEEGADLDFRVMQAVVFAVAQEREACAKLAQDFVPPVQITACPAQIAAVIRARAPKVEQVKVKGDALPR